MSQEDDRAVVPTAPSGMEEPASLFPLEPGQLVGNYRVVRQLGQGGMGAVFEAVHKDIGRRAAIKTLYPEYARHPQITTRFLNEARAVNLAQHPGLVEIFEYGLLEDGSPYLIMEYLEGELLSRRIERAGGRPLPEALDLARQIALVLTAAHDKGIVHRDLKPENVMVIHDPLGGERVKVFDFGVARFTNPGSEAGDAARTTSTGMMLGTPHYMAPEQCLGIAAVDGKADVYALGVILYEMLSGRAPFSAELPFEYMTLHVHGTAPPLREIAPHVPPGVVELVHAMLAKRPGERPSMQRVAQALGLATGARTFAPPPPREDDQAESRMPTVLLPRPAPPPRVLVVDDDADLADSLCAILRERGYVCEAVYDSGKVMPAVHSFRPRVVLLDVELPGKSGYKLCWEIKSRPETADIAVAMVSAKGQEADQKLGLAMQADAYVVKPFELPVLFSVIELLLESNPGVEAG